MASSVADHKEYALFGGKLGWKSNDWTSSDDRVRGGKSQSYLDTSDDDAIGRFHGVLDIETLGGAGFASQRSTGNDREWDLSDFAGIQIAIAKGDKKRYTFNLKDSVPGSDPETGREKASISYECDFELPPQTEPGHTYEKTVFIPWKSFTPTYRGKVQKDAKPIDLKKVKRVSIMMRSFFGAQEGDFSLSMRSIVALAKAPPPAAAVIDGSPLPPPITMLEHGNLEKGLFPSAGAAVPSHHHHHHHSSGSKQGPGRVRRNTAILAVGTLVLIAMYLFSGRIVMSCH